MFPECLLVVGHAVGGIEKRDNAVPVLGELSLTEEQEPTVEEYVICTATIVQEISRSRDGGAGEQSNQRGLPRRSGM